MCGINGIIGTETIENPKAVIEQMNRALAHRGPDADGVFLEHGIALGHRRLSIIDLSDDANQPFHSFDGKHTIVFNGEIYNYPELRAEIGDYPWRSGGDTEVILAAYRKWGSDFLHRLNGMFAFALWDNDRRSLLVARDRLGIKPLYYAKAGNGGIVFSSEIRALLESGLVKRSINRDGLADYLRYQTVHAPNTIVDGVEMLLPGHRIVATDSEMHIDAWYDLPGSVEPVIHDRQRVLTRVRELLTDAVALRMRADVDFGAFLSGGIDSSAIVGLMASVSERPINTFNVSFREDEFSEAEHARTIAQRFNTRHTEIELTADRFLELVPDALNALDHPSGDGPNTYVVSKVTREEGVKMALSGLGGDELFAGYGIFKQSVQMLDKRWVMSFPKFARKMAGGALQLAKPGIASWKATEVILQDYLDLEHAYPISRLTLPNPLIKGLLNNSKLPPNAVRKYLEHELSPARPGFELPYLSQVSLAEIGSYMQNVLLRDTDQMSMAHALEVRVPFLDHRLVRYVLGVPDPYKYPHTPKKLLTDALGELLPSSIIDRKKMGFTLPWEHWMRNQLKPFCETALEHLKNRPEFNAEHIDRLWSRFLHRDRMITWSRVWHLVVLGYWLEKNRF